MRRSVRAGAILCAAAVLVAAPTAGAEEAPVSVVQEGWAARSSDPTQPAEEELSGVVGPIPVDPQLPAQQVPEGTLPVGLLGGEPEWRSFVLFDLSAIPADATITSFVVTFTEALPPTGGEVTGIEACAITDLWAGGPNQKWENAPPFDCIFSAGGERDEASGTWTFDLTPIADAWQAGVLANNGVVLQPILPENLPVGEPTPEQSNWRVTLAGKDHESPPTGTATYEVPPPAPPPPPPRVEEPTVAPPPPPVVSQQPSFSFGTPVLTPPVVTEEPTTAPVAEPVVATEPPVAAPVPAAVPTPETPPYVWLAIPLLLLLVAVLGRSLAAEPVPELVREGATTRLIRARRGIGERRLPVAVEVQT